MKLSGNFFRRNGFVRPGDLVFDVGCKIGKMTDLFLEAGAEVICVEPFPPNVKTMRDKYGNRILVVETAVADQEGQITLYFSEQDKINPSLVPATFNLQFGKGKIHNRSMRVKMTTLDALMEQFGRPAFIKLDIEGSEYQALLGMSEPVPALCFEFGMGYIGEAWKCIRRLGQMGYEFNYTEGHHGEFDLDEWVPADGFGFKIPRRNKDGKHTWGNIFARLRGE